MKDYGKSVEWPRPPSKLQGLVELLQRVHGKYVLLFHYCPITFMISIK